MWLWSERRRGFPRIFSPSLPDSSTLGSMSVVEQERLARNESLFREVNERINGIAAEFSRFAGAEEYEYVCECSDPDCVERISLTGEEYEQIRADGTRFVLAPGHVRQQIERVVQETDDHVVVEKHGVAGDVAADSDPRAA
jgi:hypothetical protein